MDILYMLIPLSVVLVFAVIGIFAWALHGGQFDDLEREGERILGADETAASRLRERLIAIKAVNDPARNNDFSSYMTTEQGAIRWSSNSLTAAKTGRCTATPWCGCLRSLRCCGASSACWWA
ncbi:MAG: cbb3-type cytochrome oxidase assembly protein CcoS [Piscinibacter sp.]|nr:cbb3-type cytochrome oxidase assembly protein CcoS [Piscinibacter sp.]